MTDERLPADLAQEPAHESPPARSASALERHDSSALWTFDDLRDLPEGNRYEIFDGSLLVSPTPNVSHCNAADDLADLLKRQAPGELRVSCAGFGISIRGGASYLVPDVIVLRRSTVRPMAATILPPDVLLVVEILSPSNTERDLVLKRHAYAVAGIPQYWIVDQETRTVTVLRLDDTGKNYVEATVVRAGAPWKTDDPFPLTLDPADFV